MKKNKHKFKLFFRFYFYCFVLFFSALSCDHPLLTQSSRKCCFCSCCCCRYWNVFFPIVFLASILEVVSSNSCKLDILLNTLFFFCGKYGELVSVLNMCCLCEVFLFRVYVFSFKFTFSFCYYNFTCVDFIAREYCRVENLFNSENKISI